MSNPTFTPSEFNQQALEFRKMFCSKSFWAMSSEKREKASEAFRFAYLFTDCKGDNAEQQRVADVFMQSTAEYDRRYLMLMQLGVDIGK